MPTRTRRPRAVNRSRWKKVLRPSDNNGLCPLCLAEIEYVHYRAETCEYGSYTPDNYDFSDSGDWNGVTYTCPECNEELAGQNMADDCFSSAKWDEWAEEKHFVLVDALPATPLEPIGAAVYGARPTQVGPQPRLGIPQKSNKLGHYKPKEKLPAT